MTARPKDEKRAVALSSIEYIAGGCSRGREVTGNGEGREERKLGSQIQDVHLIYPGEMLTKETANLMLRTMGKKEEERDRWFKVRSSTFFAFFGCPPSFYGRHVVVRRPVAPQVTGGSAGAGLCHIHAMQEPPIILSC